MLGSRDRLEAKCSVDSEKAWESLVLQGGGVQPVSASWTWKGRVLAPLGQPGGGGREGGLSRRAVRVT